MERALGEKAWYTSRDVKPVYSTRRRFRFTGACLDSLELRYLRLLRRALGPSLAAGEIAIGK